jgi:hypothetical protein
VALSNYPSHRASAADRRRKSYWNLAIVDARGSVSAGIPALLNRLLIFKDHYLQSIGLREFGSLVRNLGLEDVILLLDSGAFETSPSSSLRGPKDG